MSKPKKHEIERALTDLAHAGVLEGLDQGDYWGDLVEMSRRWGEEHASPEFIEAVRREVLVQHRRLLTEWEVVDYEEVKRYTTGDGQEHEEIGGGNMLLPLEKSKQDNL